MLGHYIPKSHRQLSLQLKEQIFKADVSLLKNLHCLFGAHSKCTNKSFLTFLQSMLRNTAQRQKYSQFASDQEVQLKVSAIILSYAYKYDKIVRLL